MPTWGPDLTQLDLTKIIYYSDPNAQEVNSWDDVPEDIKKTLVETLNDVSDYQELYLVCDIYKKISMKEIELN
jgi:Fe-S cluster assembly scaffold protein SufB